MATELFMRRALGTLRPVDAAGEEALRSMRGDEVVHVTIKRKRNERFHRKWWAIVQAVYPHQDLYPTPRTLNNAIKAATGLAKTYTLPDGRILIDVESISFASMDEAEFEQWAERAIAFVCAHILPKIDRRDVEREVADIIVGRAA